MKRVICCLFLLILLSSSSSLADPARSDGTVTAWIGEDNSMFLVCTDGVTRRLSLPMKDLLQMSETEVFGLTQNGQLISVQKDGKGYSVLFLSASDKEVSERNQPLFLLEEERLSIGETIYSERAAAAVSDGKILYWVNRGENGFVMMQQVLAADGTDGETVSLTGRNVPEPISLCITGDALTLTAKDHSIVLFSILTGEARLFPPSGQETAAACAAGGRLYRYLRTETGVWMLENIEEYSMQLETVTPAPTVTASPSPTATPAPTVTPRITAAPTATPVRNPEQTADGNIHKGAKGSKVRKIQRRLQELGYPVGSADGIYGEQTQIAVSLFYDAIHVREKQYITPGMQKKLFASGAPVYDPYMPLQKGDRGLSVLYMQMMLRNLGYDPGKADGIYGLKTVKAVAAYQRDIGYIPAEKEVPGEYASHELLEQLLGPDPATPTDLG